MKRHVMKRMLATAIAFTMAVSAFGYTVTTAAETSSESEYVTISADTTYSYVTLSNDDSANYTYTTTGGSDEEYSSEYSMVTFPDIDLDNLLTFTPEIDVDEDGYAVVLHPEVSDEDEDEEVEIVFPDLDDIFTFTPEIDFDEDGNAVVVHPLVPEAIAPEAISPLAAPFAPFNDSDGTGIRIDTPSYVDPVLTGTSIIFQLIDIDGTVIRRLENNEVTITIAQGNLLGNDVGFMQNATPTDSLFRFNPEVAGLGGLVTITATLVADSSITGTTQFYRGFPQNTIEVHVTPADGEWCNENNYFSFTYLYISFWEMRGQSVSGQSDIIRAISLDDMDITIELYGQPSVNVGAFGSPDPDNPNRHTFVLVDEARGYITISASLRDNPRVVGTAYIYRGAPQLGGDGNQPSTPPSCNFGCPVCCVYYGYDCTCGHPSQGGGSGNDGGSSDNGNDNGTSATPATPSTPQAPTTTASIPANDNEVSIAVRVTENNAVLQLPAATLNSIVDNVEDGIVILDLSSLEDVETVAIPRMAMRRFANEGLELEIVLPQGTIRLSVEAVYEIGQVARHSRITLEIVVVGDELEVSIISGGRVITDLEGEITVTQPDL